MTPTGPLLTLRLPDPAATDALGAALGATLSGGDVLCLSGPLGAGKSALARAALRQVLAADGRNEDIPSPTYTLVQTYETKALELRHADLHRLSDPEEIDELGLFETPDSAAVLIEWPERLGDHAPPRRLEIALSLPGGRGAGAAGRRAEIRAHGSGWTAALDAIRGQGAVSERPAP